MENDLKANNFYRPLTLNQKCKSNEQVGSVLDRIDGVHGALLAFNTDGDFVGVLSSYKTIYKHHTPPTKKVIHAVIQPMLITKETALSAIATYMVAEKVYLLPLFENGEIIGTINAEDIVKRMLHDENLLQVVTDDLRIDHPLMVEITAKVKDAYSLLRSNGVSEVAVVDKLGKLRGAVTRADIKHAFIHPTDKQRFHHDNYRPDDLSYDAEKKKRDEDPIRNYLSAFVPEIAETATKKEIIKALLENEQHYVFLIKGEKPTGIVSYRNVLEAMSRVSGEDEINIIVEKPSRNVSPSEFEKSIQDITHFMQKLNKRTLLERVEVRLDEPKFPTKKTVEYIVTLQVDPYSGGQFIAHAKAKTYNQSIHLALKQIDKQYERKNQKNKKHHKKSLADISVMPLEQLFY